MKIQSARFAFATLGIIFIGFFAGFIIGFGLWKKSDVSKVSNKVPEAVSKTLQKTTPTPSPQPMWSIVLTGDIIPARTTNQQMVAKNDFFWPFEKIESVLTDADITLANLEAPLLSTCPITIEGFRFCGNSQFAASIKKAGIDIVSLANNHTLNYGWEGIKETEKHLSEQGVLSVGFTSEKDHECEKKNTCSKVEIMTVKNINIGFLGYNAVGQTLDEALVKKQIEELKKSTDFVIVSVHWGKEYTRVPLPDPSLAKEDPLVWGKKFVDFGADLVAGNHPHWYQHIEWYTPGWSESPKPIFYALGNTVFDQEWSVETRRGFLAKLTVIGTQIDSKNIEIFPIGIKDWGQAYFLEGIEKQEMLEFMREKSGE